jgi:hypothetical protein
VKSICGFVRLDFDPSMLQYAERADEIVAPLLYPSSHRSLFLPPTRGLRDWRTQMTRADLTTFELSAGEMLEELGYPRGTARLRTGKRFLRPAHRLIWHIKRKSRRLAVRWSRKLSRRHSAVG